MRRLIAVSKMRRYRELTLCPVCSASTTVLLLTALASCSGTRFTGTEFDGTPDGGTSSGGQSTGPSRGGAGSGGHSEGAPQSSTPCGNARFEPDLSRVEICIPANVFTMGSYSASLGTGHIDHTPPHSVTLSGFLIDAYEVTVARYRQCVDASTCEEPATEPTRDCSYTRTAGANENLPVSCVTITQAETFCAWDDSRRLPTEAEWERTANGPESRPYPWGDSFDCEKAILGSTTTCKGKFASLQSVGSRPSGKSPDGAYDMSGNVAEWVSDFADNYPNEAVTNPTGPSTGMTRIIRGGSFLSPVADGKTFARVISSGSAIGPIGFRCVKGTP